MKRADNNVIDLNERRAREKSITFKQRTLRVSKIMAISILIVIVSVLTGVYVLSQGVHLNDVRQWLDEMNTVLMLWRILMYGGAVIMGPTLFLTPEQQANSDIVRQARWIIVAVAIAVEGLLVQKGLATLVSMIQGGF